MAGEKLKYFVLDSSVLIKWFCEEEDTPLALTLREKYINGEIEIIIPDLALYEIANALRYNLRITENEIKEAVESISKLGITIIVPTKEIIDAAISIARQYDITVYDSYFIALASVLGYSIITSDKRLHTKTKKLSCIRLLNELKE